MKTTIRVFIESIIVLSYSSTNITNDQGVQSLPIQELRTKPQAFKLYTSIHSSRPTVKLETNTGTIARALCRADGRL